MSETQTKPFACHGEPNPGRPCTAKLTQAEAWVTATGMIRHLIGRWPMVKDLADHTYCLWSLFSAWPQGRVAEWPEARVPPLSKNGSMDGTKAGRASH